MRELKEMLDAALDRPMEFGVVCIGLSVVIGIALAGTAWLLKALLHGQ
jgi:hypothetical protein